MSSFHCLPPEILLCLVKSLKIKYEVALFNASKAVSELMIKSGCLLYMTKINPTPRLWFFKDLLSCKYNHRNDKEHYPPNIQTVHYDDTDTQRLSFNLAPSTVKHLKIDCDRVEWLKLSECMPCLETLELKTEIFDALLDELPQSLKSLTISCKKFKKALKGLPDGLEILKIDTNSFDKTEEELPPNLKVTDIKGHSVQEEALAIIMELSHRNRKEVKDLLKQFNGDAALALTKLMRFK
jgi:hypothetical protein